jgi:tryptophan synthase beta chain
VRSAKAADEEGVERTILFTLSGHGHFDMASYDNYFAGKLVDLALDDEELGRALRAIEGLPAAV